MVLPAAVTRRTVPAIGGERDAPAKKAVPDPVRGRASQPHRADPRQAARHSWRPGRSSSSTPCGARRWRSRPSNTSPASASVHRPLDVHPRHPVSPEDWTLLPVERVHRRHALHTPISEQPASAAPAIQTTGKPNPLARMKASATRRWRRAAAGASGLAAVRNRTGRSGTAPGALLAPAADVEVDA